MPGPAPALREYLTGEGQGALAPQAHATRRPIQAGGCAGGWPRFVGRQWETGVWMRGEE